MILQVALCCYPIGVPQGPLLNFALYRWETEAWGKGMAGSGLHIFEHTITCILHLFLLSQRQAFHPEQLWVCRQVI